MALSAMMNLLNQQHYKNECLKTLTHMLSLMALIPQNQQCSYFNIVFLQHRSVL